MTQIIIPTNTNNSISKVMQFSGGVLFIGSYAAANNPDTLKQYKIQSVLTMASDLPLDSVHGVIYKKIPIEDSPLQCINQYFSETNEFINKQLGKGNVLVHCRAGISRSATIIIAFLMKMKRWKMKRALQFLRQARSIVKPNDGFLQQLKSYQRKLAKALEAKQLKLK